MKVLVNTQQIELRNDQKHYQHVNCRTLILPKMLLPNTKKKAFVIVDLA